VYLGPQFLSIVPLADGSSGDMPDAEQNADSCNVLALPEPQPADTAQPAEAAQPAAVTKAAAAATVHSDLEYLLQ
jgi:hypothetical protein